MATQTTKSILASMHKAHAEGAWDGESPDELLSRWTNCREATVDAKGDLWVADPQRGHWLDDDAKRVFVDWLRSEGITGLGDGA